MTLDYTSIRLNLQTLVHLVCHCRALCTRTVYDGRHACAAKMNSEHHYNIHNILGSENWQIIVTVMLHFSPQGH